jgi:serine/threonine-protein kinase
MSTDPGAPAGEPELDEILAAYLRARDAGRAPDRRELLARYPALAAELAEYFAEEDRAERWAAPLRRASEPARLGLAALDPDATAPAGAEGAAPLPGDYELLDPIARGGMGVVYRARDRRLNRLVALKMVLAGGGALPLELLRFRNEAEAAAALDHPNIVPIYEVGAHAGQPYLAMKLVEGGSLAEHLGRFAADPRAAARLLVPVARAVHYAHQRGVLHRDLKPGNILLQPAGGGGSADVTPRPSVTRPPAAEFTPLVTDFGLAKRLGAGGPDLTESGAVLGTPGYLSPEQAAGRRGAVTTATDVYGLGAILYALLTGRPPFRGEGVLETLEQVRTQSPEPPRRSNPAVGRDLELICLKCLDKEPRRRYQSAEDLAADLQRYLEGKPVLARPAGRAERAWRWCRRNPAVSGLLAAVAASLLAGMTATMAFALRAERNAEQAKRDAARADSEAARVAERERDALAQKDRAEREA